jgi:pyruvate,water dikinase
MVGLNDQIGVEAVDLSSSSQGIGCYPGIVQGEVVVMQSPDQNIDYKNKIVCTVRTDPGWAPVFPAVKGLLIEKGSPLSHSAIIAREMGIPTIVAISNITKTLNSGDLVKMDGQSGHFELLGKN